jgi:hypothetical protein
MEPLEVVRRQNNFGDSETHAEIEENGWLN